MKRGEGVEGKQETVLGNQKKTERLRYMLQILCIGMLLFLIILALVINTSGLTGVLHQNARAYASQMTKQLAVDISYRMLNYRNYVAQAADTFGRIPDELLTEELLGRKGEALALDELVIFYEDGTVLPEDYSLTGIEEWKEENPDIYKKPKVSYLKGQAIMFSSPLYIEGNQQAILAGSLCMEEMRKILDEFNFDEKGLSCIVDRNGNVIATPQNSAVLEQLKCMVGEKTEEERAKAVSQKVRSVLKDTEGETEFALLPASDMLVTSQPLDVGDWMVLVFVPKDLGSAESSIYLRRYLGIVGASALIFFALLFYLSVTGKNNLQKFEKAAFSDPLTGGINSFAFNVQCEQLLEENPQSSYGVVFFNIKNFKEINRQFGMESGNQTLRYFHKILALHVNKNERCTRSEMDHFFLFLNEATEEAMQDRIHRILEDVNCFQGKNSGASSLRLSQGACLIKTPRENVQNYMDRAKIASRSQVEGQLCKFFDEELNKKLLRQNRLNETFSDSLKNQCFQVYFQPKVSIERGIPGGAEALVRWKHPEYGWLSPQEFVPLFEQNGKIRELDFYVFRQVCRQLAEWQEALGYWLPVSVNLSRTHMKELRMEFLEYFKSVKEEYKIPDQVVEIELTESMAFGEGQVEMVAQVIKRIRDCGFCCSLDDFGFGYSSLAMMNQLDVDTIKLDRQFFIKENEKTWTIVSSFIQLAHKLGMNVVAEGIEEEEQLEKLRNSGCDMVQGYIYSKPLPVEEFIQWYKNAKN